MLIVLKVKVKPTEVVFFARSKVGGGVDSTTNLATSQSGNLMHYKVGHILVNSPMTILNRYKLFLSQSEASVNCRGRGIR